MASNQLLQAGGCAVQLLAAQEQRREAHVTPPRRQHQVHPRYCEDRHYIAAESATGSSAHRRESKATIACSGIGSAMFTSKAGVRNRKPRLWEQGLVSSDPASAVALADRCSFLASSTCTTCTQVQEAHQPGCHAAQQGRADTPPAVDTHTCRGSGCRKAYPGTLRITIAALPRDMEHAPGHRGPSAAPGCPLLLSSCASAASAAAFAAARLVCMARFLWTSIDGCRVPSQPAAAAAAASLQLLQHIIHVSCHWIAVYRTPESGIIWPTQDRVLRFGHDNVVLRVASQVCSIQRRDGTTHSLPTKNTSPTSRAGTTPT